MEAFGPVPSRRLGRSLGINNIPPKTCTYACVYCQVGRSTDMRSTRRTFSTPEAIARTVRDKVARAQAAGEAIDYLTFVPDGEPTLDAHLGRAIALLRPLGIPIAVITNASLLWREDVRIDLAAADWVSLKVDTAQTDTWHSLNRPQRTLDLEAIVAGMLSFAHSYHGKLVTETMLVPEINDSTEALTAIARLLARLAPSTAYLSIPIRPPAESWVHAPGEDAIVRAYEILSSHVAHVEHLIGYEGTAFAATGDAERDLLGITAVHPMREDAVRAFLVRASADWSLVRTLIAEGQLVERTYDGHAFYVRALPGISTATP